MKKSLILFTLVFLFSLTLISATNYVYSPTPITLQSGTNYFGAVFNESYNGSDSYDMTKLIYYDGEVYYNYNNIVGDIFGGIYLWNASACVGNNCWQLLGEDIPGILYPNLIYTQFNSVGNSFKLYYNNSGIIQNTGIVFTGGNNNFTMQITDRTIPLSVGQNLIGISSRNNININNISFSNSSGTYNYSIMESGGLIESIQCYNASAPLLNRWVTIKPKVCVFDPDIEQIVCTPNQETLSAGNGCFVTITQAMNITFLNAGGSQVGDTFPLANVKFSNGTSELNCSQAYTANWFTDSCDTLIRYWNTTYGYIDEETMEWVSSPRWEYIGTNRENYLLSSWEGYSITSNLNNIQMIFDEGRTEIPPQETTTQSLDSLTVAVIKIIIMLVIIVILLAALSGLMIYVTNNFAQLNTKQIMNYFILTLVILLLGLVVIDQLLSLL